MRAGTRAKELGFHVELQRSQIQAYARIAEPHVRPAVERLAAAFGVALDT